MALRFSYTCSPIFVPFFDLLPVGVTAAQHNFSTFTRYITFVLRAGRGRIVTENACRNSPHSQHIKPRASAAADRSDLPKFQAQQQEFRRQWVPRQAAHSSLAAPIMHAVTPQARPR
ncbi:MAG: hypothetical protein LW713_16115, partial [Acetobacteraceae bacterium]|nr:hypothetical protein [Acetobacteraceae bacterium]